MYCFSFQIGALIGLHFLINEFVISFVLQAFKGTQWVHFWTNQRWKSIIPMVKVTT